MLTKINKDTSIDLELIAQGNVGTLVTINYIETFKEPLRSGDVSRAGRIIISVTQGIIYDLQNCPRENMGKICRALGLRMQVDESNIHAEGPIRIGLRKKTLQTTRSN